MNLGSRLAACPIHDPCLIELQAANETFARMRKRCTSPSSRNHGGDALQISPSHGGDAAVLYVVLSNPFSGDRCCYGMGSRARGEVPEDRLLKLHLEVLAALPSRLAGLRIVVPRDPHRNQTRQHQIAGYLDVEQQAAALPFPVWMELLPNNSLGSYGMFLHAYQATRNDGYGFYIFSEDDYIPVPAHFDSTLIRLHRAAFGSPRGSRGGDGILTGVLQGRPIEPLSPFDIHLESSCIVSAQGLSRLVTHVYETVRWNGSLADRMQHLTKAFVRMTYFGRIQLGFGLLLLEAGIPMRDWTAAFRAPYWNHFTLVDWTGPIHNYAVPPERVLFVPIEWFSEQRVKHCCAGVDCDTRRSDVCRVGRQDADPDRCCRSRQPRLSNADIAARHSWSLPNTSWDVRQRASWRPSSCDAHALLGSRLSFHKSHGAHLLSATHGGARVSTSTTTNLVPALLGVAFAALALARITGCWGVPGCDDDMCPDGD